LIRVFPGSLLLRTDGSQPTSGPPRSKPTEHIATGAASLVSPDLSLSDNPLYGGAGKYQRAPAPKRKGSGGMKKVNSMKGRRSRTKRS